MMSLEEMRALKKEELTTKILEWKQELFLLTAKKNREKKAEKPHMFRLLRQQIARANTLRNQKDNE